MDSSVPSTSRQSLIDFQYRDQDDSDNEQGLANDQIQRRVDDDSDDSESEYQSEDDPDIGSECPTWSISTRGMRPIEFAKTDGLLVPIPGEGTPRDFFNLI